MFVGVDPDPAGKVEDGLDRNVGVAQQLGEGLDQERAEALDAADACLTAYGGFGEMDVERAPRPE